MTATNMVVKVNDLAAYVTGYNAIGSTFGQKPYEFVRDTSKIGSDIVFAVGLQNIMVYGTNRNGQKMWVHGNATEHIYDDVYAKMMAGEGRAYTNPNLYTQELMSDFYGSLEQANVSGIKYGELIPAGNWEFIFAPPIEEGLLPVIKHAQFNGW